MARDMFSTGVNSATTSPAESAVIEAITGYFCRLADTLGLPRSAAQIYSTLFLAEGPISFTEVVERSGLSKASASTGLKLLERMRAAEIVPIASERGTFYRPELSMRRLAAGFLDQSLLPGLDACGRLLASAPESDDSKLPEHFQQRLSSLRHWHEASQGLLPMITALGDLDAAD